MMVEKSDMEELKILVREVVKKLDDQGLDHDLLVKLETHHTTFIDKVEFMMNSLTKIVRDHESRIRKLEWAMACSIGAILIVEFIIKVLPLVTTHI